MTGPKLRIHPSSQFLDAENFIPSDVYHRRDRQDLRYVYWAVVANEHNDEAKAQFMCSDLDADNWPLPVSYHERLTKGYTGYADIWPEDRSANMVGVEREPIESTNLLTDIPDSAKSPFFTTALDMLRSELFATYEEEQRRLGVRDSSILEADSDLYHELHVAREKEINEMSSGLALALDTMLKLRNVSTKRTLHWKKAGLECPKELKGIKYIRGNIDWRFALQCAVKAGVPKRVIRRATEILEQWRAISNGDQVENTSKHIVGDAIHSSDSSDTSSSESEDESSKAPSPVPLSPAKSSPKEPSPEEPSKEPFPKKPSKKPSLKEASPEASEDQPLIISADLSVNASPNESSSEYTNTTEASNTEEHRIRAMKRQALKDLLRRKIQEKVHKRSIEQANLDSDDDSNDDGDSVNEEKVITATRKGKQKAVEQSPPGVRRSQRVRAIDAMNAHPKKRPQTIAQRAKRRRASRAS